MEVISLKFVFFIISDLNVGKIFCYLKYAYVVKNLIVRIVGIIFKFYYDFFGNNEFILKQFGSSF